MVCVVGIAGCVANAASCSTFAAFFLRGVPRFFGVAASCFARGSEATAFSRALFWPSGYFQLAAVPFSGSLYTLPFGCHMS